MRQSAEKGAANFLTTHTTIITDGSSHTGRVEGIRRGIGRRRAAKTMGETEDDVQHHRRQQQEQECTHKNYHRQQTEGWRGATAVVHVHDCNRLT
jgi:hypothetical protein